MCFLELRARAPKVPRAVLKEFSKQGGCGDVGVSRDVQRGVRKNLMRVSIEGDCMARRPLELSRQVTREVLELKALQWSSVNDHWRCDPESSN